MIYNPNNLEYKPIFTQEELITLEGINKNISLESFLKNKNLVEKFGFDFVYTSVKIEGNTYSKADALTLIDYEKTAGGKDYRDAKMLLNLHKSFQYILSDELVEGEERGSDYVPLSNYYDKANTQKSKEFFIQSYQKMNTIAKELH